MASERFKLQVAERPERGSRETRRLRREGMVPGVVYGAGQDETQAFKVGERDLRAALVEGHALLDLELDGKAVPVLIKDQQLHPVRGSVQHIDFQRVRLDEKINATVPVELEGGEDAPGVKEGGVIEHVTRELNIEALPTDIPDRILVDVSALNINENIQLPSLTPPSGVTFLDDEETTIAILSPPRVEVEPEPEVEEETERVGEEGEGAEAPAEGEGEPAEGGGEGE